MKKLGVIFTASILLVIFIPVLLLAVYPQSRVFIPEAFGVVCSDRNICIDDQEKYGLAEGLVRRSLHDLKNDYSMYVDNPKVIFCSTDECKSNFGLGRKAAYCVGTYGIAVAPRGWEPHYIKHELIHYWQAKTFGNLVLYSGEKWFTEGMAYSLSGDPRARLEEPWESHRKRFEEWYETFKSDSNSSDQPK